MLLGFFSSLKKNYYIPEKYEGKLLQIILIKVFLPVTPVMLLQFLFCSVFVNKSQRYVNFSFCLSTFINHFKVKVKKLYCFS